jgi:hypothetical protein
MKKLTPSQQTLIHDLLEAAGDDDANTLDDLLVHAGYWWECRGEADALHGFFPVDHPCDICGQTFAQRPQS